MRVQKEAPVLPNTQVIFSSDTIYFNIHINIYEQKNIIIYIHRDTVKDNKNSRVIFMTYYKGILQK